MLSQATHHARLHTNQQQPQRGAWQKGSCSQVKHGDNGKENENKTGSWVVKAKRYRNKLALKKIGRREVTGTTEWETKGGVIYYGMYMDADLGIL